jgi:hypothetical protein
VQTWMHKHADAASHWSPWIIKGAKTSRCLSSISEATIKL